VRGVTKTPRALSWLSLVQENISSFLQAARALGLPEFDCFCTPDLFEAKDVGAVSV
jgi:hypothetical protein